MIKILALLISFQLIISPIAIAQSGAGEQFREKPDSEGKISYVDQVSSIVIAGVGTTCLLVCSVGALLPSLVIFNAGSIVYIASELTGGKAQNNFMTRKASDLKMLEEKMKTVAGGEVQKEALEAALKDEEEILSIINKRKKWLGAISAIYALATIAALLEVLKVPIPGMQPPAQIAACNPVSMVGLSNAVRLALFAAYSFTSMKGANGSIGKYGSFAAAMAIGFTTIGLKAAALLNLPPGRLAAFAIATALIKKNQSALTKKAEVAEKNIEKLKSVLAQFNKDSKITNSSIASDSTPSRNATSGAGTFTAGVNGGALGGLRGSESDKNYALNPLAYIDEDPNKNCWSKNSGGMEYSTNCSNPVKLTRPNFDLNMNIPTLRSGTILAMDLADGIASGKSANADAAAGSLASMAGKINEVKDGLFKLVNQQLTAKGEKPLDLDKSQQETETDLQNSFMDGAKAQGFDLASLGGSDMLLDSEMEDEKGLDIKTETAATILSIPSAQKGINERELTNAAPISEGDISRASSLEESLTDYESNENDISGRSEDSIFKQVTYRYQTYYPTFFKRKEIRNETEPEK